MSVDSNFVSVFSVNQQPRKLSTQPVNNSSNKTFAEVFASVKNSTPASSDSAIKQDGNPASTSSDYRNHLINSAKSDAMEAEKLLAYNIAPNSGAFPLIDISNWPTVRYSVSGELQTPESEAYFSDIAKMASTARTELVQAERSKGTPTADILEKVLALNAALPPRYKAMANISY
ncbi:hypothetical protein [Janthinobacterium aquaticum]|uniref:hypothetical protein n=1 Tax=Janthinobacterium sp. FT58W TaxID=2654254 RepID=UPI001D00E255|nr:hypothetical protein [Janthinobacterium sp. FT58W]